MYRIVNTPHHRAGTRWCIYPTYDWAHGQSDSIEGITHSICGMEFRHHRPLYDWYLEALGIHHPRQIEYPRINVTHTMMGKRFLLRLVESGAVAGWDDPRLPTIQGMRRRGYPAEAIKDFCRRLPLAEGRRTSTVEFEFLEHCIREHLNRTASRAMAVLRPVRLVLTSYPAGSFEELPAINNPEDPTAGSRNIPFGRELFIERDDFMENPVPGFHRLSPGREVRLRYAWFVRCQSVVKDVDGNVIEIHATHDPATRGGDASDGRSVKSTLHWVSAAHAVKAEVRLYDHLFPAVEPSRGGEKWIDTVNRDSLEVLSDVWSSPGSRHGSPATAASSNARDISAWILTRSPADRYSIGSSRSRMPGSGCRHEPCRPRRSNRRLPPPRLVFLLDYTRQRSTRASRFIPSSIRASSELEKFSRRVFCPPPSAKNA